MTTTLNFDLINGTFKAADARRVLMTLINDKISFHELEIFSAHEKYGKDLPDSIKRVKELNEALLKITEFLNQIDANNSEIQILGSIDLVAVDKKIENEVF